MTLHEMVFFSFEGVTEIEGVETSSSIMLTVCCCVPFSLTPSPPETAEISTIIVSLSSSVESFTPVRVAVPVVAPALIVMLSDSV